MAAGVSLKMGQRSEGRDILEPKRYIDLFFILANAWGGWIQSQLLHFVSQKDGTTFFRVQV